jgi:hypothetical protein
MFDAFYERLSVARTQEGLILVFVKYVNSDDRARELARQSNLNTPVKYVQIIQGFDCSMNAYRSYKTTYYGSDYSDLGTDKSNVPFMAINKGSIGETLMGILCKDFASFPVYAAPAKQKQENKPTKNARQKDDQVIDKYN